MSTSSSAVRRGGKEFRAIAPALGVAEVMKLHNAVKHVEAFEFRGNILPGSTNDETESVGRYTYKLRMTKLLNECMYLSEPIIKRSKFQCFVFLRETDRTMHFLSHDFYFDKPILQALLDRLAQCETYSLFGTRTVFKRKFCKDDIHAWIENYVGSTEFRCFLQILFYGEYWESLSAQTELWITRSEMKGEVVSIGDMSGRLDDTYLMWWCQESLAVDVKIGREKNVLMLNGRIWIGLFRGQSLFPQGAGIHQLQNLIVIANDCPKDQIFDKALEALRETHKKGPIISQHPNPNHLNIQSQRLEVQRDTGERSRKRRRVSEENTVTLTSSAPETLVDLSEEDELGVTQDLFSDSGTGNEKWLGAEEVWREAVLPVDETSDGFTLAHSPTFDDPLPEFPLL